MAFTQYFVLGSSISVSPGMLIKDLDDDQLKRRKSLVKETKKKGVYECLSPFSFKHGEVVWLDSDVVNKNLLKVLHEPKKIVVEETVDDKTVLDDMSMKQLIAYAEEKKLGLSLNMKMLKADMVEAILDKLTGQEKKEPKQEEKPVEENKTAKAPKG